MLKPPQKTSRRNMQLVAGFLALLGGVALFCAYEDIKRLFPDEFAQTGPDGLPLPNRHGSSEFQNAQEARIEDISQKVENKHYARQLEKMSARAIEEERYLYYRDLGVKYGIAPLCALGGLLLLWRAHRRHHKQSAAAPAAPGARRHDGR